MLAKVLPAPPSRVAAAFATRPRPWRGVGQVLQMGNGVLDAAIELNVVVTTTTARS
jgi:hypothetical protein